MDYLASWVYPSITNFELKDDVRFHIHNEEHLVKAEELDPRTTLNQYLRSVANLTGTKNMCFEGGCGTCVVTVSFPDPITKRETIIAVNSVGMYISSAYSTTTSFPSQCLVLIYSCAGWKIYTADGIGDPESGYHPIQNAMVKFNGTQCGYCTSGMIMNMYALYESKDNLTMKEVENSFGGNICRCTGYRPIMTAFKSLASDASADIVGTYSDIEDIPVCKKENCWTICETPCNQIASHVYDNGPCKWYKVFTIKEILDVIKSHAGEVYMLVGGNTASGVYKDLKPVQVYIDITGVKSLLEYSTTSKKLTLGANMTLKNTMTLFNTLSENHSGLAYLKKLADHIDLIAHVAVRNIGTLAGNLMTKHKHKEFPSDIFLILETVGATVTLINHSHQEVSKTLLEFLNYNMEFSIIKNITLPFLDKSYLYESYKIMPVAQNAHAMVNAGFLFQLNKRNFVKSARIVYGGINPDFVHATACERYVTNMNLFSNETLQGALEILNRELTPDSVLPDPSPKFRKDLGTALLYKFILSIAPDGLVSPRYRSGGMKQERGISKGTQEFGTNKSMYPLTQPVNKLEALAQTTGKAEYFIDMPDRPNQLFAAFVVAKAPANSIIEDINTAKALSMDGVKAFYDKNDIPGENDFMPPGIGGSLNVVSEELFCTGTVKFYYQPIGIVVATSQALAATAADLVEVTYTPGNKKPLLTIKDIIKNKATNKIISEAQAHAKTKGNDVQHVVKGDFNIGWQYHYHMETQCCVAVPTEDGLNLYPSTQDMNLIQVSAAKVLKIPVNKINVVVRRLGGSYGGKALRNGLVSCSAALAAHKLQKPVKFFTSLEDNMNIFGGRFPFYGAYEVGVNKDGVIQYLNASAYSDFGSTGGNGNLTGGLKDTFVGGYNSDTFNVQVYSTRTDTHTGTWTRAPATLEAIAYLESIMQHIAVTINMDPITVRLNNTTNDQLRKYTNELVNWANVRSREKEIRKFNKENRWVKKGLSVAPMVYPIVLIANYHAYVAIFEGDGTVAVTHGGIEMGQGINTKVAQVCAYTLKIPLDFVSVKPSQTVVSSNNSFTGASITSERVCLATIKACEILIERMKPIRDTMAEPVDWPALVYKCYVENVNLCGGFMFYPTLKPLEPYSVYAAACVETEVDVLTGLRQIKRVDILEDTGDSMSPNIDIGQIEGGFIMGMGYWTSEEEIFDSEGKLLTNRTWNYKPPGAKDIPEDFRVKLPKNNPNNVGVLHSKATGEPATALAVAVALSIKDAVGDARVESSAKANRWYPIDGPCTVENTFLSCLNDYAQYKL